MFIQRAGHGNVACSQTNIQYLRGSGRDKHNVKAVRKQLMEQTESLPFCSKLLSVLHLWDRSECMHAYRWELCVVHVCVGYSALMPDALSD